MSVEQLHFQGIGIGHLKADPSWRMKRHFHLFHEVIVILQGRLRVSIHGQTLEGREGDVLLYRRKVPHEEEVGNAQFLETYFIAFGASVDMEPWPLLIHDVHGRIRRLAEWLHQDREQGDEARFRRETTLRLLLLELQHDARATCDPAIQILREFMRRHLDEPLTLDALARQADLSRFHFLRWYKQRAGRTPMEDLRLIRVEHARNLILTSNLPLKAVATCCGLGDDNHLSRLFQRYLKTSPGSLRREAAL